MTDQQIVEMIARAYGLTPRRFRSLCALIGEMRWPPGDLRRLLEARARHSENYMLIQIAEWMQMEQPTRPQWRSALRQLRVRWGRNGEITFVLPKEDVKKVPQLPDCAAKRVLLRYLRPAQSPSEKS